jgi:hypothetical protein
MTLTTRRMILEVMRSHVYVKLGRYEMFLSLSREAVGEDRFSWSRGERVRTGEASEVARERDTGDRLCLRGRRTG